ncbi:hypothetical protein NBRC111894_1026 [Sporolactobacillus inulinus]|uniref:Uncharacterized protein n=1 Tax=Sporolactobacillus inulinus TaxID=2078 RepID=A0A4Y1Z8U9_9BACL|nr:hypothetical protein NBRC111894_1026 [Sporolactobacillus inulinus]
MHVKEGSDTFCPILLNFIKFSSEQGVTIRRLLFGHRIRRAICSIFSY